MDIWGFCGCCGRWFYCADWVETEPQRPTCPVCADDPIVIENRATAGTEPGG